MALSGISKLFFWYFYEHKCCLVENSTTRRKKHPKEYDVINKCVFFPFSVPVLRMVLLRNP